MSSSVQIRNDILELTKSGGRMASSEGHAEARRYLVTRLQEIGVRPYSSIGHEIPYERYGVDFANVVAMVPGSDQDLNPVVLGAHYDTCGDQPGADDNAAAVAIVLDLAERFSKTPLDRSIIFAFFDAEEPPYFLGPAMGSIRFFENQLSNQVHCAIVMDLVGHDAPVPGMEDVVFLTGMESDPVLGEVVIASEPDGGIRIVPTLNDYVEDMSDHHIFRVNDVPYFLVTNGRWEHYHRETDTFDKLNMSKIEATADYVSELLERVSSARLVGPSTGNDTTGIELDFLKRNVQPALKAMGTDISLKSRKDIDQLIGLMLTRFEI